MGRRAGVKVVRPRLYHNRRLHTCTQLFKYTHARIKPWKLKGEEPPSIGTEHGCRPTVSNAGKRKRGERAELSVPERHVRAKLLKHTREYVVASDSCEIILSGPVWFSQYNQPIGRLLRPSITEIFRIVSSQKFKRNWWLNTHTSMMIDRCRSIVALIHAN